MKAGRIAAVVLAGGAGTRLGAHVPKPLVPLGGRPMIAHVLERLGCDIAPVLISANDEQAFAALGHPVVPDRHADRMGPLAGLEAATLRLREHASTTTHLVTLPGDTPFLPNDIVSRLTARLPDRPRIARIEDRLQPTVALWPTTLLEVLSDYLARAPDRSLVGFAKHFGTFETVDFQRTTSAPGGDPFFNVNTPAELAEADAFFAGLQGN